MIEILLPEPSRSDAPRSRLDPFTGAYTVVPGTAHPWTSYGLYVGTGGDVAVTLVDGSQVTYKNVPAGMWLDVTTTLVLSTGTTASNIIAHR
jgi:hypothetical protein